jgi:dienelactone hydrolase
MIVLASGSTVLADKNVDVPPVEPGDEMIHAYLSRLAVQTDAQFLPTLPAPDAWAAVREQWRQEYFYMLGLSPMPERPPLNPIITGTLQRDGYAVDKLWFESRPHLVVTANLYRPTNIPAGAKLPAVLYVCGHGSRRPEGTKAGYQSPPIWFARHGYVCLILDTLDRGEIKGVHRGLFSDGKRWWLSRGYTPAGVECWNGIRGIDYLVSRPDVDASRIAVTGISGGGAATFWIAAADDRVKAAVPISGMADLQAYVADNKVEVHCDCMFMGNIFAWPWSRIAALVAPRPLLFVNSDNDKFFPIDANERVINRLERWYGMLGAGDKVDAVVSVGGHDYRQDIRQAACRFINIHLKNDPSTVTDSEQDLVKDEGDKPSHPIELKDLAVFPDGKGLPADAINATVDQVFVPMAKVEPPPAGQFDAWKQRLLTELRRVTFRAMPERVPMGRELGRTASGAVRLGSEEGIECRLAMPDSSQSAAKRIVLMVSLEATADASKPPQWLNAPMGSGDVLAVCQPRGVGDTRWNAKAPPNRVERQLALVGRTVETGQVWDVIAAARYLASRNPGTQVIVAGEKAGAVLATYAALLEPEIAGAILKDPPASHMEPTAPQFLNVLRVCDVPQAIGMLAPRPLTLSGDDRLASMVKQVYATAGVTDRLTLR